MPRQPRLDAPGLLQHVMARGIERRKLFRNDKDRKAFLDRLADILEETQTQCYVYPVKFVYDSGAHFPGTWALIPNHFHLLLRTGPTPLSKVMRRLMTGYAVTFNKRHKRSGHLFQNRYKSIVCDEDPYLLELIRYIHLNPLRARLVRNLKELDKYPWSGHSAILGHRKNPLLPKQLDEPNRVNRADKPNKPEKPLSEKTIEDLLLHFGHTKKVARRKYREFVENGIDQGKRPDLQGGGLLRSAGGNNSALLGRKREEREKGDARILGSGDFVNTILRDAEQEFENASKKKISLEELISIVAKATGVSVEELLSPSRKRRVARARAIVTYAASRNLGYRGTEIAKALSLSPPTVSQNIDKGRIFLDRNQKLKLDLPIT